ncbi:(Fe-S)-binding protein [Brevibacillus humidisoli]|uniref:(Fe-S)-binding protein n=1 Tax=Brevibacillus humidisoli TaxID=2895522 RepID=UPI0030B9D9DD
MSRPVGGGTHSQKLFDLAHDATNQCVQCGYCLPACPTYESMGKETASPRGRINLVKMAAEGKMDVQQDLAKPIDLCLGCRACEVACPVGVPYGHILEAAKEVIADADSSQPSTGLRGKLKTMILSHLFPYPRRLRALGNLVWLYQKLGFDKLARKTRLTQLFPEPLGQFEKVLPPLESPAKRNKWGTIIPAKGEKKARVAFFPAVSWTR